MYNDLFNRKALFAAGATAAAGVGGFVYLSGGGQDGLAALDASYKAAWGALLALIAYRLLDERSASKSNPDASPPSGP
jgi:hypothetical protein